MGLPWQVAGWNLARRRLLTAAASKRGWPLLRAIRISDMLPSGCTASSSVTVPSSPLSRDIGGYCTDGWRNSLGGTMSLRVHSFGAVVWQADKMRAAANINAMFFMRIFHFEKVQAAFFSGLIAQTLADGGYQACLVERVKMQTGCTFVQQAFAHVGHHVQGQCFDGGAVVGIRLQFQA